MISKFEQVDEKNKKFGSRLAIVFSGSPILDHEAMNAALDPPVSRFTVLMQTDEDEAELIEVK